MADAQADRERDTSNAAVCDRRPIITVAQRADADDCRMTAVDAAEMDGAEAENGGIGAAAMGVHATTMILVALVDPS